MEYQKEFVFLKSNDKYDHANPNVRQKSRWWRDIISAEKKFVLMYFCLMLSTDMTRSWICHIESCLQVQIHYF